MMDLEGSFYVASSGMRAQSARLRVVAENLANADSTADVPGGDPYRRRTISFREVLDREHGVRLVQVARYGTDPRDFVLRYEPWHPAADERGYVKYPNVDPVIELVDMREAQRTYEANLQALATARSLLLDTIDVLR